MFKNKFDIGEMFSNLKLNNIRSMGVEPKYLALAGIGIVMVGGLLWFLTDKNVVNKGVVEVSVKDVTYTTETIIELINEGGSVSNIYKEGEKIETDKSISSKGKAMELPVVNGSYDIEKKQMVRELTYEATLDESAKYINFLKAKGYELMREVRTPEYIEFYMTKGKIERRIIILNNIIITGKLGRGWKLPDIETYFKK